MKSINIVFFFIALGCCITSEAQDLEGMGFDKGLKVAGGINIAGIVYNSNDSVNRRDPFQMILTGNLNLNMFGYETPFSFTYSNSQRSYTQPFNRFSFSPRYKWVKAYLGRTSMTFSPYTLSGHSFTGAGFELTPGNWRFALMGGQMKKAIDHDQLSEINVQPAYRRMGYGVKLGYEKATSGIIVNLFTARDQRSSTGNLPPDISLQPLQNIAMGISGRTTIAQHVALEGEYSISFLDSDIPAGTNRDDTINRSDIFGSTATSKIYNALSASAGYQSSSGGIMLKYERIDPDYQTLGAYYFNNDMENFTIAPSLKLLDGKFSLNGNIGMQKNNLDGSRESTTKRFAGAGNISFSVSEKLNLTFNYSNFSSYTNLKPQDDPFFRDNMDSLNFYQVTNQASGTINYSFGSNESPSGIMLLASFQKASEAGTAASSDFITANASYTTVIPGPAITLSVLYSINSSGGRDLESLYQGPGISIGKSSKEKNIRMSASSNYNTTKMNGMSGSHVLASNFNINYSPHASKEQRHNISANLSWVKRFRSEIQPGRREITVTVNYNYSF